MKNRRRRVSREDVRNNARQGPRGGQSWFKSGIESWAPDKPGVYVLDVVPYEVTDKAHPDGIEPGILWYKRAFVIHHEVGPNNGSVVCPLSIGQKKCPIHEERARIGKSEDGADEKTMRALKGQDYVAMNILDPDNKKKTKVFCMSYGKFMGADAGLQQELESGADDILGFFDTKGGKTLKVKFKEDSFQGRKFLKCVRIDFEDRADMDEEKVLSRVTNLDEMLNVMEYSQLKSLFLQEDDGDEGKSRDEDDDDSSDDSDSDDGEEKSKKKGKKSSRDDEDDDDDDSSNGEEDDDGDDDEDDSDDGEDEEEDRSERRSRGKRKSKDDDDDSDDGE